MSEDGNKRNLSNFENRLRNASAPSSEGAKTPVGNAPGARRFENRLQSAMAAASIPAVARQTPIPATAAIPESPVKKTIATRFLGILRNKHLLLTGLGILGVETGVVIARFVSFRLSNAFVRNLVEVMVSTGIIAAFLNLGLFTAIDAYHRKSLFRPGRIFRALAVGAICGAISGAIAQLVFSLNFGKGDDFHEYVIRPTCWGIYGVLLGLSLTRVIPNLGRGVATISGALGGFLGGLGFLLLVHQFADLPGQLAGFGALAIALALAVSLAEVAFREGHLEIIWASTERTFLSLGRRIVYVGGGPRIRSEFAGRCQGRRDLSWRTGGWNK